MKDNLFTKLTQNQVIERMSKAHNDFYDYSKFVYRNSVLKGIIICPKHGEFLQAYNEHYNSKQGCPKCWEERRGENRLIPMSDYVDRAKKIHNNYYDYSKVDYNVMDKKDNKVIIICPEHGEFLQSMHHHVNRKQGCSQCSGKYKMTTLEYVKKAEKIYKDAYDFCLTVYINRDTNVNVICKKHGLFTKNARLFISGSGCPKCGGSSGEKIISSILDKHHIKYIREYKLEQFRYDFYIPKLNIIIEYDGRQHFDALEYFGGLEGLIKIKKRDQEKNNLCRAYNIYLIRIPYTYYNDLEYHVLKSICNIYKYYVDKKFFLTFLSLCKYLKLPDETTISEVDHLLSIKHFKLEN